MRNDAAVPQRSTSVLVVDDDHDALTASATLLEVLGYRVTAVDDPLRALALVTNGEHFDVMLTDIVMPKMSGIELGEKALSRRADLHVVYATGFSEELAKNPAIKGPVLLKPWTVEELEEAIRS